LLGDELSGVLHTLARRHGPAHRAGCARAARGQRRGHHREHRTEHVSPLHQEAAHGWVFAEVDLALEQVARDLGIGHRVLRGLAGRVVDGLLRITASTGQRLGARQAHAHGRALGLQLTPVALLLRHRTVYGLVCVNAWDEGAAGHDRGGVAAGAAAHRGTDARLGSLGNGGHARESGAARALEHVGDGIGHIAAYALRLGLGHIDRDAAQLEQVNIASWGLGCRLRRWVDTGNLEQVNAAIGGGLGGLGHALPRGWNSVEAVRLGTTCCCPRTEASHGRLIAGCFRLQDKPLSNPTLSRPVG